MSMTKEEAIEALQKFVNGYEKNIYGEAVRQNGFVQAIKVVLSALRPITREQVEKVWRGECDCSNPKACCTCCSMRCQYCIGQAEYKQATFCMKCGRPLTDKAVEMVMERLEALKDGKDD